jgi:menaquinone-9 beta-reductase
MNDCDVIVVGGGPAGSTCAWKLRQAGLDVVVIDRAAFPRDKVCAGWITPQVVEELDLDITDYRRGRTFQPIMRFRTGVIGGGRDVETRYPEPVSYGIRRCEFDHYLLQRAGARLQLGAPVAKVRREHGRWIVNDATRAPMLVGAGGHFCPVQRWLNGAPRRDERWPLIVAQEVEFPIPAGSDGFPIAADTPELYFRADLSGYGWCFRKEEYLNVGLGVMTGQSLPAAIAEFVAFLAGRGTVPAGWSWPWRGHAYLLHDHPHRRVLDEGLLLAGDSAGLAYPQSGEGIRPAIESGLMAASTIVDAHGDYTRTRLEPYRRQLDARFGAPTGPSRVASAVLTPGVRTTLARALFRSPRLVRHVVLNRWFLHAHDAPLATMIPQASAVARSA